MVQAIMILYDAAKTRVTVASANLEEFKVKVDEHQTTVLSSQLSVIVVDDITENVRSVTNELLHMDDLFFMSKTM